MGVRGRAGFGGGHSSVGADGHKCKGHQHARTGMGSLCGGAASGLEAARFYDSVEELPGSGMGGGGEDLGRWALFHQPALV
ncbi:hypothetical protein GCM10010171_48490 [Actinokineospora fastidiosa]|uniref:Uncharacterized protein n=1 Tax=Actinokineospora fastidiosa TaxID=1816 RepID=A0A918GNL1_9PSEU|nr:hypothetical protein GCM10010171_48490 [Actinokineospora fastidiosa]